MPLARWRWLALLWLALVLLVGVHQVRFWLHAPIESDVLALLPEDAHDPALAQATRRIADASARRIVVLLGTPDAASTQRAVEAFRSSLRRSDEAHTLPLVENTDLSGWFEASRDFFQPWRDRLLTPDQRDALRTRAIEDWSSDALSALYSPLGAPRLTDWQTDPLNLWSAWWQARAAGSGLQLDADGLVQDEGQVWAVLQFDTRGSAFRLDGEPIIRAALDRAVAMARTAVPALRELRTGVPLYAEAAAVQANREINIIGWGSLAAVLLLVWLAFRSLRPIALVALSLIVGVACALSVTAWVFGTVHLLTLVFGASLVGVAEDYGIHWFASRQAHPTQARWPLLRGLLPGLSLALGTSALAYLALGLAPFPGLRQMAVFSVVGLTAAFLTVICWFPWLDRTTPVPTRFSTVLSAGLASWPRLRLTPISVIAGLLLAVVTIAGLARLKPNDDLRSLQALPADLVAQQGEISRVLGLPSPAQFYLVRGADAQTVLQRETALTQKLVALADTGRIRGYRAISDWLPTVQQQEADAALSAAVEVPVLARLSAQIEQPLQRAEFASRPLTLEAWLASQASLPLRHLWLGAVGDEVASVVMVDGLAGQAALASLKSLAAGVEGVRWVDRTAEYSALLGHYRHLMSGLLLVGLALVALTLAVRYRRAFWRAAVPTVLAAIFTLAVLGWLGVPLQLFNVLALLLLVGMGIDYGIFLLEHRGDASAWLAVCVGAASTWLSFGLLALSATPALRAFGLTLLLGIGLVWLLSLLFRPGDEESSPVLEPDPESLP
ncbi:MAG TPA: hypothetical protein VFN29_11880 [Chiayiivirga sp.]|nr:hypothetical protein [Chiayiivirga sp.]